MGTLGTSFNVEHPTSRTVPGLPAGGGGGVAPTPKPQTSTQSGDPLVRFLKSKRPTCLVVRSSKLIHGVPIDPLSLLLTDVHLLVNG